MFFDDEPDGPLFPQGATKYDILKYAALAMNKSSLGEGAYRDGILEIDNKFYYAHNKAKWDPFENPLTAMELLTGLQLEVRYNEHYSSIDQNDTIIVSRDFGVNKLFPNAYAASRRMYSQGLIDCIVSAAYEIGKALQPAE